MGRKPKPTNLKKIEGNPGCRPLNGNEPRPTIGELKAPPEYLNEYAKKEWERLAPILHNMGLLTELDYTAFEAYCQSYSNYRQASEQLDKQGLILTGRHGQTVKNPLNSIVNIYQQIMLKYLSEFGLTPSSRSKVTATQKRENKFSKYQR